MSVCVPACTHLYVCVEAGGIANSDSTHLLWERVSHWPGTHNWTSQEAPEILLCLPLQGWNHKHIPPYLGILKKVPGDWTQVLMIARQTNTLPTKLNFDPHISDLKLLVTLLVSCYFRIHWVTLKPHHRLTPQGAVHQHSPILFLRLMFLRLPSVFLPIQPI